MGTQTSERVFESMKQLSKEENITVNEHKVVNKTHNSISQLFKKISIGMKRGVSSSNVSCCNKTTNTDSQSATLNSENCNQRQNLEKESFDESTEVNKTY